MRGIEQLQITAAKETARMVTGSPFERRGDKIINAYDGLASAVPDKKNKKGIRENALRGVYPFERREVERPKGVPQWALGKLATSRLIKGGIAGGGLAAGAAIDVHYGAGAGSAFVAMATTAGVAAEYAYHRLQVPMGRIYDKHKTPDLLQQGETPDNVTPQDITERAIDGAHHRITRARIGKVTAGLALTLPPMIGAFGAEAIKPDAPPISTSIDANWSDVIEELDRSGDCAAIADLRDDLFNGTAATGLSVEHQGSSGDAVTYVFKIEPADTVPASAALDAASAAHNCS